MCVCVCVCVCECVCVCVSVSVCVCVCVYVCVLVADMEKSGSFTHMSKSCRLYRLHLTFKFVICLCPWCRMFVWCLPDFRCALPHTTFTVHPRRSSCSESSWPICWLQHLSRLTAVKRAWKRLWGGWLLIHMKTEWWDISSIRLFVFNIFLIQAMLCYKSCFINIALKHRR